MELNKQRAALEAVLFACGEPIETARLAEALEVDVETTIMLAEDLRQEYAMRNGGIRLVRMDDCYEFRTDDASADVVRRALDIRRNTPLSQAAMEVLAIVAYNQPVTKSFVEQVRGVDCGAVMQGLLQKNLLEERGRLELPGRPLLYGTTPVFLRSFNVSSIDELPPLPQSEQGPTEVTLEEVIRASDVQETAATDEISDD